MKSVFPNIPAPEILCSDTKHGAGAAVLTVWRKSLLFNCSGFTVYDVHGNLAYRVDSYTSGSGSGSGGEIVLMDAAGKAIFTSHRKKLNLSFGEKWLLYDGEGTAYPRFVMKKHTSLRQSKMLAHVTSWSTSRPCSYNIEGSYVQRCCVVYSEDRRPLAEIRLKEAASNGAEFGADVFRLIIYPGIDRTVAMAIVLLLDQMFKTSGKLN